MTPFQDFCECMRHRVFRVERHLNLSFMYSTNLNRFCFCPTQKFSEQNKNVTRGKNMVFCCLISGTANTLVFLSNVQTVGSINTHKGLWESLCLSDADLRSASSLA